MAKAGNKQALRTKLLAGLAVLGLGQAVLQAGVLQPLWSKNYSPAKAGKSGSLVDRSLSPDQMLFALAGFRELIAGILWVRADSQIHPARSRTCEAGLRRQPGDV